MLDGAMNISEAEARGIRFIPYLEFERLRMAKLMRDLTASFKFYEQFSSDTRKAATPKAKTQ